MGHGPFPQSRDDAASAQQPAVRVLIADGRALIRAGLRILLDGDERIQVVGVAATGEEAVALSHRNRPEVVLIDTMLPGLDSVEATAGIVAGTGVAVMLLTTSEGDERVFPALRAGASGLLLKDTEPANLLRAIQALARGEALLSPTLTRRVIAELASRPRPAHPSPERVDERTSQPPVSPDRTLPLLGRRAARRGRCRYSA